MPYRPDSRSLDLFRAVAEAASVRQAAERLHLSQPPLSRAIRELEERLGCQLFERHAGGMALTAAGRALLPFANKVAGLLQDAQKAMAAHVNTSTWRLGLSNAVEPAWFSRLAQALPQHLGGQAVTVVSDTSPRLVRLLRAGRLDAACIALPTQTTGLHVREVDRLPMMVALPSCHPLARRKKLCLADLVEVAGIPVFWFERARQPAFYDHCEQVFAQHGFKAQRLREPEDHHVLLAAVAAGSGFALLPASFASLRRTGVAYRPLIEGQALSVGIGLVTAEPQPAFEAALAQVIAGPAKRVSSRQGI